MKNYIPIKKQLPWRKILGETWRNHHLFFWRNMRIEIGTVGSGDLRDIFQNHGWYGWSIFSWWLVSLWLMVGSGSKNA
jgi:hypothetical protein